MKPILFPSTATDFSTLGVCALPDAESCTVTEKLNGQYELEMVYPIDGRNYKEISDDMIIAAVPSDGAKKQAFRIYRHDATLDGKCVFNARHISYQLNYIPITPVSGVTTNAQAMLNAIKNAAQTACPFTFWSDISGATRGYVIRSPGGLRAALGGSEGSVLDTFGGEYEFDNWAVKLHEHRGTDNNVRITYGKNLTGLRASVDVGGTITGVMAYYQGDPMSGSPVFVYSSPKVITLPSHSYGHDRIAVVDCSQDFEGTVPTTQQVTAWAQNYLAATSAVDPNLSVDVDFVALWQTEEYKDLAPLERVKLGDTVYVSYRKLGVTVKKKVTETVYNVLADRYDSIKLGSETDITDTIVGLESEMGGGESVKNIFANSNLTNLGLGSYPTQAGYQGACAVWTGEAGLGKYIGLGIDTTLKRVYVYGSNDTPGSLSYIGRIELI